MVIAKIMWGFFKNNWLTLFVALIPFAPNIYEEYFTKQSFQFIYEKKFEKSPVEEWNRAVEKFTQSLDPNELNVKSPPPPLLRAIGKEISKSIPAMLAGIGFKPFDSITVIIYNQSNSDLVNVRVHFMQCKDHFEIVTSPDTTGSIVNSAIHEHGNEDAITVNYGRINRKSNETYLADIRYFGREASKCIITVDAERDNGVSARGEEVKSINERIQSEYAESEEIDHYFNLAWKFLISILIIYLFTSLNKLKKQ